MRRYCVSLLVLPLLSLAACGGEREELADSRPRAATTVITAEIELKPMVDKIQALGTAGANESIEIQPRIASLVDRILFTEGALSRQSIGAVVFFGVTSSMLLTLVVVPTVYSLIARNTHSPEYVSQLLQKLAAKA